MWNNGEIIKEIQVSLQFENKIYDSQLMLPNKHIAEHLSGKSLI